MQVLDAEVRPIPFTSDDVERLEAINRDLHANRVDLARLRLSSLLDELMLREFLDIPGDC